MLTETSTGDERERLARVLTPAAPPRVLEHVYTDDQYRRLLDVVQRHGPWPTITVAPLRLGGRAGRDTRPVPSRRTTASRSTTSRPRTSAASTARTRSASTRRSKTASTTSRSSKPSKSYWGARYAKPTMMLFNICGPHHSGLNPHLDATTFRGVRYENTPVWLQNIMAKSGLFSDYIVKMAQVITWWYRGEAGTFTYWPDGPLRPPKRLERADVEPRRRRAERAHVPSRRSGRSPGATRRSPASSTVPASSTGPQTTTGSSRPTAK